MLVKKYLTQISETLDQGQIHRRQELQSSHPVLRKMKNLVYMRIQNTKVEIDIHKAKMTIMTTLKFSGLTKFGLTPGGGGKA